MSYRLPTKAKSWSFSDGWRATRDHGGCVFIDLRDREGITQIVFDPELPSHGDLPRAAHDVARALRSEWVVGVRGVVKSRGANKNPKLATGEIEVQAIELTVFNKSDTPPFEIADQIDTAKRSACSSATLDLRRAPLQKTLRVRHRINQVTRRYFDESGFLELETPVMVKYTRPAAARNFLVPSRMHTGKFYALAESPQLFKQLYMVAGFERYFQIVKCFRDEDLRLDRQPEFTQIDVEMSFVSQDDVFRVIEGLVFRIWKEVLGIDLARLYPDGRFPQMPFEESMSKYGNDKPDLRFALPHVDLTDIVAQHRGGQVAFWQEIADRRRSGGGGGSREGFAEIVKAMRVPADLAGKMSRAELDKLEEFVKGMGAKGLARAKVDAGGGWVQSPLAKTITPELRLAINQLLDAKEGDLLLFHVWPREHSAYRDGKLAGPSGQEARTHPGERARGAMEVPLGRRPAAVRVRRPKEGGGWRRTTHSPGPTTTASTCSTATPARFLCWRYDLVLNGVELGGGSIRLHDPVVQAKVFRALGISDEEARSKFGFLLDALRYGAPPHGGIANRDGSARDAPQRRREPARRHPFPQDTKGNGSHDRCAERGGSRTAPRAEESRTIEPR